MNANQTEKDMIPGSGRASDIRTAYNGRPDAAGSPSYEDRAQKYRVLKSYYGYDDFKEGQAEIIDNIMVGKDVVCIMPTGAGKSVCYQIPALMKSGMTLVISPLISLMKDQVSALLQMNIPAAYINSSLTAEEYSRTIYNMRRGRYKIVYAAPERLQSEHFAEICREAELSFVAVDEAHCISQWGQDFRPSYLRIAEFVQELPERPVIGAFTATATPDVKNDITALLQLNEPFCITTSFDRPNLSFTVIRPDNKERQLLKTLAGRRDQSGIIYCTSRKDVEHICDLLNSKGYEATRYHAGLSDEERIANQDDFIYDRKKIMTATNAFGMGIDKSDVAFVIHYSMPKNIESYYQEAGRAGRDGSRADCILFYSPADVHTIKFFIENPAPNDELSEEDMEAVKEKDYERLKQMVFFCTTRDCLREFIREYFGEKAPHYCGNCSNCLTEFEKVDFTIPAQMILSCVYRCRERYGITMISDVLRGMNNQRVLAAGLDRLSTYGLLADTPVKKLRHMIEALISDGYLKSEGDKYPVLRLTERSADLLRGKVKVETEIAKEYAVIQSRPGRASAKHAAAGGSMDEALLAKLKKLRLQLARTNSVPAYVIFTDATLEEMCIYAPRTRDELLDVKGVGEAKAERYGDKFLEVIRIHLEGQGES